MIVSIFLIASVSAYETHKLNDDLFYSFTSNNATECQITTANTPYGELTLDRITDRSGQTFSTTILAGNFSEIGDYCFNIVCYDGVKYEGGSFCKTVSPNGFKNTVGFYFIILLLSLGVVLMGYYMEDSIVVMLGSFGLTFVGLFILFNGIDTIRDTTYTWAIGIIILCLAAYFGVRASQESLN